jgi:hypothetical protein
VYFLGAECAFDRCEEKRKISKITIGLNVCQREKKSSGQENPSYSARAKCRKNERFFFQQIKQKQNQKQKQ